MKFSGRNIARLTACLAMLGGALHVGCAMPRYLRVDGLEADDDGFERVIRVDEHGNVERGDSDNTPIVAPRAASVLPYEVHREDATSPSQESNQPKFVAPQPVEPTVAGTSLGQQSDDFHNKLAQLRQTTQPTPAAPEFRTPKSQIPSPKSEIPSGVEPTIVRSQRFKLDYDDQLLGPDGIARVELYGTRDNGRTWQRLGEDKDRRSPYDIDVEEDGLYGFRIAVAGHNGLASRPPKDGELPELWVKVDRDTPAFKGNLRASDGEFIIADNASSKVKPDSSHGGPKSKPDESSVVQASHQRHADQTNSTSDAVDTDDDWQTHLDRAITDIEKQLAGVIASDDQDETSTADRVPLSDEDKGRLAAQLRMLQLARGRHEQAIRNSPHHSTEENEYWSHQIHGMHLLVSADDKQPVARRAAAALTELRGATDELAAYSELQIANLTFCTAAHSFGVFETKIADNRWRNKDYREAKFEREQPVILYFEVNNFLSEQHTSRDYPDGAWRTSFKGTYTILDRDGRPLDRRELQLRDDICRNRRHDYFVAYKTWMPEINPGHYTLELLIEDTIAGKIGTATIDFEIVAK